VLRGHLARAPGALNEPDLIRRLLETPGIWAVVGCSPDPGRDSHRIAALLKSRGHRIAPVNPAVAAQEILGERAYATVAEVPDPVTVVDVFRRADQAGRHVDEAIEKGVQAVWLQLGVIDEEAAARAEGAGLGVVMDRCPAIEYRRLGL
jgi:predicted CoA-binding protein